MPARKRTSAVESRLRALGLELPPPRRPVANYVGCKQSGDLLFVSGQIGDVRGAVGSDVTKDDGRLCARQAALCMLGTVKGAIGDLDRIASIDKVPGFVRSAPDFTEQASSLSSPMSSMARRIFRSSVSVKRAAISERPPASCSCLSAHRSSSR